MKHKVISVVLFLLFFSVGSVLSLKKALWNDELYTQIRTTQVVSYGQIINGTINEGGNAPLFYLLQKAVLDIAHYRLEINWEGLKTGRLIEAHSQFLMRIVPNICISAALVLIFNFFASRFSLGAGILSLVVALSNFMLLSHWVEARPYAVAFLVVVCQIILLYRFYESSLGQRNIIKQFSIVHILMAMTLSTATGLIIIAGIVLFLKGMRRLQDLFLVVILPLLIAGYYAWVTTKVRYSFPYKISNPVLLWHESFGIDVLLVMAVLLVVGVIVFKRRLLNFFKGADVLIVSFVGVLIYMVMTLEVLLFRQSTLNTSDLIELNSRFFIFLAPWSIFATSLLFIKFFRNLWENKINLNRWVLPYCWFCFCFLVFHAVLTFKKIYSISLYAY